MSLIRKGSKASLRVTPDDLAHSLDQKNSIIAALQAEVEHLRANQERFDRAKEQLHKARMRHEALLRDQETTTNNHEDRVEAAARHLQELKIQADHLAQELRLRGQALKDTRMRTQELIDLSNRKEDEATEAKIKLQDLRSQADGLDLEQTRLRTQAAAVREECDKAKQEAAAVRAQTETISEKCFKTQAYLRGLLREEANLNEALLRVEEDNAKLESVISELSTAVSVNEGEVQAKERACQDLLFRVAGLELERKRLENESREKSKQLGLEKEKWRALCQGWEIKRQEAGRLEAHQRESSQDIAFLLGKNNEVEEVNHRLSEDLRVCQKHQENVSRANCNLQNQINTMREISLKAISKLQEPLNCRTNQERVPCYAKWSSRASDFDTNDFDRLSDRS